MKTLTLNSAHIRGEKKRCGFFCGLWKGVKAVLEVHPVGALIVWFIEEITGADDPIQKITQLTLTPAEQESIKVWNKKFQPTYIHLLRDINDLLTIKLPMKELVVRASLASKNIALIKEYLAFTSRYGEKGFTTNALIDRNEGALIYVDTLEKVFNENVVKLNLTGVTIKNKGFIASDFDNLGQLTFDWQAKKEVGYFREYTVDDANSDSTTEPIPVGDANKKGSKATKWFVGITLSILTIIIGKELLTPKKKKK